MQIEEHVNKQIDNEIEVIWNPNVDQINDYLYPTELRCKQKTNAEGLLLVSQNVQSCWAKETELNFLINDSKCDILAMQETWTEECCKPDYQAFLAGRQDKRGGGVGILAKNGIKVNKSNTLINDDIEVVSIETNQHQILSVYKPPKGNPLNAFNALANLLNKNKTIYVMGDFNINLAVQNYSENSSQNIMLNFCEENELKPITNLMTRVSGNSETRIDNILTNDESNISTGVSISGVSDHHAPFCIIKLKKKENKKEKIIKRDTSDKAVNGLINRLENTEWIIGDGDLETETNKFFDDLDTIFNEECPIQEKTINNRTEPLNPWVTKGLLKSRQTKLKLLRDKNKTKSAQKRQEIEQKMKTFQKIYNKTIRLSKKW